MRKYANQGEISWKWNVLKENMMKEKRETVIQEKFEQNNDKVSVQ